MLNKQRTTAAAWVRSIASMLETVGVELPALFEEAGVDLALLSDPQGQYATESLSRLWEVAAARTGNPAIGLAMSHIARPSSFDVITYAIMSCPTLLPGLERLVRYTRIVSDAVILSLQEDSAGYWLNIEILGGDRPVPIQRVDFIMVTSLTFFRWLTDRNLIPVAVEWTHAPPDDQSAYREAFQCPLHFNAMADRMLFSHADVSLPLPTSNPMLVELHDRYASEYLERLDSTKLSHKIRELLVQRLPDGDPMRGDIAQALCLSERTLQRRLQEEGTTFHDLVDDIRRELAQRYLKQPHLSISQTAYLLGFADQSTFFRACKRWFELSPRQYRTQFKKEPDCGHD
jgi:AraC-like DNA-binding protein